MKYLILCLLILSITGQYIFAKTIVSQSTELINDLPLILTPTQSKEDLPFVFFISGDGGWTKFDQEICDKLAAEGMPVVRLNARKYFWKEKFPEVTIKEFSQVINYYLNLWNKKSGGLCTCFLFPLPRREPLTYVFLQISKVPKPNQN